LDCDPAAQELQAIRARVARLRAQVREFCRDVVPADLRERAQRHQVLSRDDYSQWMKLLSEQGWLTPHWPVADGGSGWSVAERFALDDELARVGLPWVIPAGVKYVGPVICQFGTAQQKARFLPGIRDGSVWWAQGFSEPGAGSDLAAVATIAERDGDRYIVNGQKLWTTYAQWADWMFVLVRTKHTARPRDGVSFLLVDMRSPGVTVNPIPTMDGFAHVNEVWLQEVVVPVQNRVGEENGGWPLSRFLLKNERTAGAMVGHVAHALHRLEQMPMADKPLLRRRAAEFELRFMTLQITASAMIERLLTGRETGIEPSLIKIRASELYQQIAQTMIEALGAAGVAYDVDALHRGAPPPLPPLDAGGIVKDHLYRRAATLYGGATEIQRNLIAVAVLGLGREGPK
jgi:alkylation response protein AidB-like acyl-CoA dehydrogenase